MQRVSVVGTSGVGKTTLTGVLARALDVPALQLDAVHHLPGWTPIDTPTFRERVGAFVARPGWVVDGNYAAVRDLVWARADTVVYLDYPRWRVMRQLVPRTLRRLITREELYNGNREQLPNLLSRDPDRNILLWAWTTHRAKREEFTAAMADPANAGLRFVHLTSPAHTADFVRTLRE
ncbi:MAG: adenylate kinase [Actinomycetota bacterium]